MDQNTDKIPAIPPDDYKGSISSWIVALKERGLYDEDKDEWYGNVEIDNDTWWEILEECEGDD